MMEKKFLTQGRNQLIKLKGTNQELWLDGLLRQFRDWTGSEMYEHEETFEVWEGLGCLVMPNGKLRYFAFSTEQSKAYWIRDLEPTIILPLSCCPGDSRYVTPRIIEEEKIHLIDWIIEGEVLQKLLKKNIAHLPLPRIIFRQPNYKEALEKGFVYNANGQRTLVLSLSN